MIAAIDNPECAGLFIPRYASWDRSDSEKHTKLILTALDDTDVAYARVVRLVKHWNYGPATAPLRSWNIKALALESITSPIDLLDGLHLWFTDAIAELRIAETEDPAGVAEKPIKFNVTRTKAVEILQQGLARLDEARSYQDEGYLILADESLSKLFNDPEMLPCPNADDVHVQYAAYRHDHAPARLRPVSAIGVSGPARLVVGSMTAPWVTDPTWSQLLHRDALGQGGDAVTVSLTPDVLTYHHAGVEVTGRRDLEPVTIEFHRIPRYCCFGLLPEEYPRVLADVGARSLHRMPEGDRLCLWMPKDPPEQRWSPPDGLQGLLDPTVEHLLAEEHWRLNGGDDEHDVEVGVWPIP